MNIVDSQMRLCSNMLLMSMSMMCCLDCAAHTVHRAPRLQSGTDQFCIETTHVCIGTGQNLCTHSSTDLDSRKQHVSRMVAAETMAVLMLPQKSNLRMKPMRCSKPETYGQLALILS